MRTLKYFFLCLLDRVISVISISFMSRQKWIIYYSYCSVCTSMTVMFWLHIIYILSLVFSRTILPNHPLPSGKMFSSVGVMPQDAFGVVELFWSVCQRWTNLNMTYTLKYVLLGKPPLNFFLTGNIWTW